MGLIAPFQGQMVGKFFPLKEVNKMCECEHADHEPFDCVYDDNIVVVNTIFGKFNICGECVSKHPIPDGMLK